MDSLELARTVLQVSDRITATHHYPVYIHLEEYVVRAYVIQQEIIDQLIVDLTELEVVVMITERNASGSGLITNRVEIIAVHLQVIQCSLIVNRHPRLNHIFNA